MFETNDLHFYSLKSILKLNWDYENFQNHFRITKIFWNQFHIPNAILEFSKCINHIIWSLLHHLTCLTGHFVKQIASLIKILESLKDYPPFVTILKISWFHVESEMILKIFWNLKMVLKIFCNQNSILKLFSNYRSVGQLKLITTLHSFWTGVFLDAHSKSIKCSISRIFHY